MDIDPDLLQELRERAFESGKSFKETVNAVLRRGVNAAGAVIADGGEPYEVPSFSLGRPQANLDKALALAGDLEDGETVRDLQLRK